jgi:hypothetical protein
MKESANAMCHYLIVSSNHSPFHNCNSVARHKTFYMAHIQPNTSSLRFTLSFPVYWPHFWENQLWNLLYFGLTTWPSSSILYVTIALTSLIDHGLRLSIPSSCFDTSLESPLTKVGIGSTGFGRLSRSGYNSPFASKLSSFCFAKGRRPSTISAVVAVPFP